jgi:Family of unknown function (DUF5681)
MPWSFLVSPENRAKAGKFQKGQSGNPGGRKKLPEELKASIAEAGARALEVLQDLMEHSKEDGVRLRAAVELKDTAYGRPRQSTEISGSLNLGEMSDEELREAIRKELGR